MKPHPFDVTSLWDNEYDEFMLGEGFGESLEFEISRIDFLGGRFLLRLGSILMLNKYKNSDIKN